MVAPYNVYFYWVWFFFIICLNFHAVVCNRSFLCLVNCSVWRSIMWVWHNSFISSGWWMFILVLVSDIVVMLVKNILVISFGNCMYLFQVGYIRGRSTGVEGLLMFSFRRCCKQFLPAAVLVDVLTTSVWDVHCWSTLDVALHLILSIVVDVYWCFFVVLI